MDNSRLEVIKKWFDDWGEIEEDDFEWLVNRLEGYILSYEVILERNERMEKKLDGIKEYYPELFV